MTILVFDTDVMVAALRSASGASRPLLLRAIQQQVTALISVPLFIEYEAVLKRPEQLKAIGATKRDVDIILDQIAAKFRPVEMHFLWRPFLPDHHDDMVLETAINGNADLIVTFNLKDYRGINEKFAINPFNPAETIRRLS